MKIRYDKGEIRFDFWDAVSEMTNAEKLQLAEAVACRNFAGKFAVAVAHPGWMRWERFGCDEKLVADDGEILDRVHWRIGTSEYVVESTGKHYIGMEAAKKAAERKQGACDISLAKEPK